MELNGERHLVELLDASVEGNVTTILHMLTNDIPGRPPAAHDGGRGLCRATGAARCARLGPDAGPPHGGGPFPGEAQRAGAGAGAPTELKRQAGIPVSLLLCRSIDRITQYLLGEYEQQRTRWASARGTVLLSQVHAVLARQPIDHRTFAADTG